MIKLQIESEEKGNIVDLIKTAILVEIKRLEIGLSKTELQIANFKKIPDAIRNILKRIHSRKYGRRRSGI